MKLRELIEWLRQQDPERTVTNGFDAGRIVLDEHLEPVLSFVRVDRTTLGRMLANAEWVMGNVLVGPGGIELRVSGSTECHVSAFNDVPKLIWSNDLCEWSGTVSNFRKSEKGDM